MGNVDLFIAAALAVFTLTNAQSVPTGSTVRVQQRSNNYVDQIRVLTKPKPLYNKERDTPLVWDFTDANGCVETSATDFVGPIDTPAKCCKKAELHGITVWAEQSYTVLQGDNIVPEDIMLDPTAAEYPKPGNCKRRVNTSGINSVALPVGTTYDSYIIQAWGHPTGRIDKHSLIEFPNQDVVALIWRTSSLQASDKYFALGGNEDIYSDIRVGNGGGRMWEVGNPGHETIKVNCEEYRPSRKTCPVVGQKCGQVWGDPHMITFDNLRYDCQGRGEFVLVKSTDDALAIHGVFEDTGGMASFPSVTRSVAIKVDASVPVLQVTIPDMPVNGKCDLSYTVSQTEEKVNDIVSYFKLHYSEKVEIYVQPNKNSVIVFFTDYGARIEITVHSGRFTTFGCRMRVKVCINPDEHGGPDKIVGLMGNPTNSVADDWMVNTNKNPVPVLPPTSNRGGKAGTDYCRANWCVAKAESLYSDSTYDGHNKCSDDSFDQEAYDDAIDALDEAIKEKCRDQTGNPDECIADIAVAATQDDTLNLPDLVDDVESEETISDEVTEARPIELDNSTDWVTPNNCLEAGSKGDPHFKTWQNEHFEFHGQCDIVLVRDPSFAGDLGLEVQIRTKLVRFWSYIKTAAILIGNDILEIEGSPDPDDHEAHYWFNYEKQADAPTIGGFPLSITKSGSQKRFFEIDLGNKFPGKKIVISTFREFVRVDFKHASEEAYGNSVGMLGDFKTGDTLARDGHTVIHDFSTLGNEWQVLPEEPKLFHTMAEPQFPRNCLMPEDPRGERRRHLRESTISVEAAEAACSRVAKDSLDLKDCVYDVLATQDLDMVGAF